MIEATCAACGNVNRVPEADIPVGAKYVKCGSCKARVALPTKTEIGPGLPSPPPAAPPPIPPPPSRASDVGLSDLPAPKPRGGALGAEPSKPAPKSGLAAALDADLPAPRPARSALAAPTLDLPEELLPPGIELGLSDLPTPRSNTRALATDLPAPKSAVSRAAAAADAADLPAPKQRALPEPRAMPPPQQPPPPLDFDLPAPKGPGPLGDLPAPRAPVKAPPVLGDLPVPKTPAGIIDLPSPKGPTGIADLPQPRPARPAPAPPKPDVAALGDLQPKAASKLSDLPTPKAGAGDLPAPKGFFDDLPQPSLHQPAKPPELPAPKGFFDDLPGRVNPNKPAAAEVPAPKGFFDDLPGRVNPNKPAAAEVPAPKGFFDDLPGRVNPNKPEPPAPKGFFDDLPQPSKPAGDGLTPAVPPRPQPVRAQPQPPQPQPPPVPVRPEPAPPSNAPLELPMDHGPQLYLHTEQAPGSSFDDLDLSAPTSPAGQPRAEGRRPSTQVPSRPSGNDLPPVTLKSNEATLELEEPRPSKPKTSSSQLQPKKRPAPERAAPSRARTLVTVVLLLALLGGGGFLAYKRFFAKSDVSAEIGQDLARARVAIAKTDATHWDVAAGAARRVLEKDDANAEALAIGAEGLFGSALANGVGGTSKLTLARKYLQTAAKENAVHPRMARAQALSAIAANTPDAAIEKLKPLIQRDPKDLTLVLYLGWAQALRGDAGEAIKTFDQAAAQGAEAIKLLALYGRAQVKLAQLDLAGARADFDAVYQLDKNHIGAQVGLAAALPIAQAQQQEEDLRAVLARKDIADADPRAVGLAWVLSAEAAKRGNRLDAARERYRKALAIFPDDLRALAGLAETELLDGKLDAASEPITKALALSKEDIRSQIVQAEISIRRKDLRDATERLDALAARTPPPSTVDQSRIKLAYGRLYEAQNDDDKAVAAFEESAKLAGETDLAPTLAAVDKLTQLADKATAEKDTGRATELRERADTLLGVLDANAEKDLHLALTLGMAYLSASNAAKAEPWLRRVVEARPEDAEGQFQLAKALSRLGKHDDAIVRLQKAMGLAPSRSEIGVELALLYESLGRDTDAAGAYKDLLAAKDVGVELRARAGRFYARTGDIAKAAEQGAKILESEPRHTAGLYLKGEGLLAQQRFEEARALFMKATEAERDPLYLDALGRANEELARKTNDTRMQDAAIRSYSEALELAPQMYNPHAGLGRLYVARREFKKAVSALGEAYKIKRDPDIAYNIGLAYKELQDPKTAIIWFDESLKTRPNAEAYYNLGQLYLNAAVNDGARAASALTSATRMALADEKKTDKPIDWLTEALYQLGDTQMALSNLSAAKEAWLLYIGRKPPMDAKRKNVERILQTGLRDR